MTSKRDAAVEVLMDGDAIPPGVPIQGSGEVAGFLTLFVASDGTVTLGSRGGLCLFELGTRGLRTSTCRTPPWWST